MKIHLNIILLFLISHFAYAQPAELNEYNPIWNSPSKNSSESMPCGGGDIGLNVWVEQGDILFYISRSGSFDENNQMLKLGRVRLKLSSNPFNGNDFKQELKLADGGIIISGGNTVVRIWVDVFRPFIHLEVKSPKPVVLTAAYESWRFADHLVLGQELKANSYKVPQAFEVKTYKDEILSADGKISFVHRNRSDKENIFDYTVRLEGMQSTKDQMFDPITNNTFGGMLSGTNMKSAGTDSGSYAGTPFKSWKIESKSPARSQSIEIALHVDQAKSMAEWNSGLNQIIREAGANKKTALARTQAWWHQFWNRSYIFISGADSFISRNYQLFRYQLACNAYGKWPTKFNGGLFTFDPVYIDEKLNYSPDFRLWGGGTMTAQNQRLVYYPMLKSGDFDMLKPQFDFYLRTLKNAELRSQIYWHHDGACYTEQIENFGLPNITEYQPLRPAGYDPGMQYNPWLEYLWETVFEFCQMMLETERYEHRDIQAYIPLIESCLTFYDAHYRQLAKQRGTGELDENGQYILYPTSAAETYKITYNSITVISALKTILERLIALPADELSDEHRKKWIAMLKCIPPLPFQYYTGHKTLAPALAFQRIQNVESPQLYPVFPWGIYGIGKPNIDIALDTWKYDTIANKFRTHTGWQQHNIFAARLGLTSEAKRLTMLKFKDGPHRFPSFWGPGYDWTPDHNWGGTAMIGLQEMLVQTDDKKIFLLPAWPMEWNVHFKLHLPYQTTIEASVKNGALEDLIVIPASRKKDIILMNR